MEFENIIYKVDGGIATIQLNRPKALNALNSDINHDIMEAIKLVQADDSVRVLIMTGSERAFAAGADVKEMAEANPRYARQFCGLAIEINNILESLPIPTIAAVGGFAFGGGCEMTLACDFRVGGPRTTLSFPEVGLGIIPGANGCARATAIVGPAKAKQLVMLTEMIPGKQAYDLGLLNWFVEGDAALNAAARDAKGAVKAAKMDGVVRRSPRPRPLPRPPRPPRPRRSTRPSTPRPWMWPSSSWASPPAPWPPPRPPSTRPP